MNNTSCTYRFIESSIADISERIHCNLIVRQQPERAKVSLVNERDRRPIEPPPILQLRWDHATEEELKKCLQSPFYFMVANLVTEQDPEILLLPTQDYLSGSTVSSLHRLCDLDNSDAGFFVFGDLNVKKEGTFRLQFSLFEIVDGQVENRKIVYSNPFTVYLPKHFPGPLEATFLSRAFSDQGVKMKIRKEHRIQCRKRKNTGDSKSSTKPPPKRSSLTISSSPPSYAHPSSNSSDVFFGRWQATTRIPEKPHQSVSLDKHNFQHTFPSPESTATYSPFVHHRKDAIEPDAYSSAASSPQLSLHDTQPRLPTPPAMVVDHQDDHWGVRLPPLRAIMNDDYKNTLSTSLILPPPIASKYLIEPYSRY
ncbi:hypothetical protein G6F37_005619 [Rhizopus arrhizus]|nr:hypothetical protein G6F38_008139 [Rhizopus arrhizus]KAG1158628.1 hypothetical protein G6F37_005619 [Rhizopus arrhizus]